MANIYEFLNTTGCLPTIARFLIVLCSFSIELAQTFVVIATNYMHDPSDCLLHKERVVLSGEQAVSLETLPDRFNAWSSTYRGIYRGQCVAVKVWRGEGLSIPSKERTDFFRKLEREIIGWQAISHTNIATVYGLAFTFANLPSLVTNYYPNGNINDYLSKNPTEEKNKLLIGVASGLQYLHQLNPPVSHGDVRGSNIFIADNGDPVLCDLGLSQLPTPRIGPSQAMMAQESFTAPMSDVYSFGMTVMEVHTYREHSLPYAPILRWSGARRDEGHSTYAAKFRLLSNSHRRIVASYSKLLVTGPPAQTYHKTCQIMVTAYRWSTYWASSSSKSI
ncbi:hypothetical protein D9757_011817 [Collybiopsis confluens]|uniref:Protein kinase domain-containing protein n=1 Tax=Collybiopsis confluens TaxID=2823264 RepID=A0A8H5GGF0_9AGAR|nr:hypothetical protein D9757_011817 [Collybiopsis confluens]